MNSWKAKRRFGIGIGSSPASGCRCVRQHQHRPSRRRRNQSSALRRNSLPTRRCSGSFSRMARRSPVTARLRWLATAFVFSMPTSTGPNPDLRLVTIPADQVEWTRTASYAESARAARYLATRAPEDYLQLSNDVSATLKAVAATKDPAERLTLVEAARRKLAAWPAMHYHYREPDVQQMLTLLDAAVADLRPRAAAAVRRQPCRQRPPLRGGRPTPSAPNAQGNC